MLLDISIFKLGNWKSLPSDFAEGQLNMWKLITECFIHVFLQVGQLHVFNDRCLKKEENASYFEQFQMLHFIDEIKNKGFRQRSFS